MEAAMTGRWRMKLYLSAFAFGFVLAGCDATDIDDENVSRHDVLATASVDEAVHLTGQEAIHLRNVNGDIEIVRQAPGTMIQIDADLVVGSYSRDDAEEWLAKLNVRIERKSRVVAVTSEFPTGINGRRMEVHYRIGLPEGLDAEVEHVNGTVTIKDVVGHVDVEHVNGTVKIDNLRGTVDVNLINGRIECEVDLDPDGFAFLNTVNGEISLNIPRETSARLHAGTDNGQVRFNNLELTSESGNTKERSGMLGAGHGQIELKSVNGSIDVRGM